MVQPLIARVTCPNCHQPFQTRIERILDVRAEPRAKSRLLGGLVNVAVCPQCHTRGALNLPFLYHDPIKELALVYLPMDADGGEVDRQQTIGKLTTEVMDNLPQEERKGYLFQPQVFLTVENLIKAVLEADGVTEEMLQEQQAKSDLLQRLIDASSDSVMEAMIKENDAVIDASVLRLLNYNLQAVEATGQIESLQRLRAVQAKLLDHSSAGRKAKARAEVVDLLREDPTREKLLQLLVDSPDTETKEVLVSLGISLMDYVFFQSLSSLIEAATDEDEKTRLSELRKDILRIRDEIEAALRVERETRVALLRDLLLSRDPEALARQRLSEIDEMFFSVLAASLRDVRAAGDNEAVKGLVRVEQMTKRLIAESIPPEVRLLNQLLQATDPGEIERLVRENAGLVEQRIVTPIEQVIERIGEDAERAEEVRQLSTVLEIVRKVLAE